MGFVVGLLWRVGKEWVADFRVLQEMGRHLMTLKVVSLSVDISACGKGTQGEKAL